MGTGAPWAPFAYAIKRLCILHNYCFRVFCFVCRQNRNRKAELELDWSDKKETDEIDTFNVELRNEHTRKQFHPGVVKFLEL